MWSRSIVALVFLFMSGAPALTGCSSMSESPDEELIEQPPGMNAAEAYEAAARWLPADAMVVVSSAGPTLWEMLGDEILPTANPNAAPGDPGTVEALRADFKELLTESSGFDIGNTAAIVFGLNMHGGIGVLFGDFELSADLPTVEVQDTTVYEIDLLEDESGMFGAGMQAYLLPIDEPQPGVVITERLDDLERMQKFGADLGREESLATAPQGAEFSRIFGQSKGSSLSFVASLSDLPMLGAGGMAIPEWAALHYNYYSGNISAIVEADDPVLADIENYVEDGKSHLQTLVEHDETELTNTLGDELLNIYSAHTLEALIGQLDPKRSDRQLSYDLNFNANGLTGLWAMSTMGMVTYLAGMEPGPTHEELTEMPTSSTIEVTTQDEELTDQEREALKRLIDGDPELKESIIQQQREEEISQ